MMSLALESNIRLPLATGMSFYSGDTRRVPFGHFLVQSDRASIVYLLFRGGPSAISGFVIAILVWVAINRAAFWASPHISKEILEFKPSLANGDAPSAIIFIGMVVLVSAPFKHLVPRFVFWAFPHAMFDCSFPLQAPTRRFAPVANAGSSGSNLGSAGATEAPDGFSGTVTASRAYGHKSSVLLTRCHRQEFSSVSHFSLQDRLTWLGPAGVTSTASGPFFIARFTHKGN